MTIHSHRTFGLSTFCLAVIILLSNPFQNNLNAQTVSVGQGSYSTSLPAGALGPQNADGQPSVPLISEDFSQPVQTNDFWSSLLYPFFGDLHSGPIFAHPINVKATNSGLQVGATYDVVFAGSDYLYPFTHQLTVGVGGLNVSQTTAKKYGDWTFTAEWDAENVQMEATTGHGLPYIYFKVNGGNAEITLNSSPDVWYDEGEVMGITIDGKHYGIFAPSGSDWEGSNTIESSLNGQNYFSLALLPDDDPQTLELFRKSAYAFVTDSKVNWEYDEATADLKTNYIYSTELMEDGNENVNHTLTALYRHQWKNADQNLTDKEYASPRGTMKLYEGNEFSTSLKFSGIVPALPDQGSYDREELLSLFDDTATEELGVGGGTYNNGKAMGRFAELVHIADQLGATEARDHFLNELKNRLEDWLTAGGAQEYSYNAEWNVLTGYPSGFGADTQINDHHFHSSYAIRSAATVAQYDPVWASLENWGGMVNMLIKDSNNWDREDTMFPFLRSQDAYAGHSWASGHGAFGDGNNQESSSESMNFASSVFLWGSVTGQDEIRDLGIYLHTTERTAIEQYWFDVEEEVFPETYAHNALGIVWGGKGAHGTWFGADPEFIHGINFLPINSGSLYLGRHPDYVQQNYDEIVSERGSQPIIWKDVLWEYLALADPEQALSYYNSDSNYDRFDGESRAHTYHWLHNLNTLGVRDTSTYANIPTYSVFEDNDGYKTYSAYNPSSSEIEVIFTDGFNFSVPAAEMKTTSTNTSVSNEIAGVKPDQTTLHTNYPNPFNPTTNISFTLKRSTQVTLEVFNVAGQKVGSLANEENFSAGSHTMNFDAGKLASGVYIYQLRTEDGFSQTRKMVLVK